MQQLKILNSKEKKRIEKLINEQFNCDFSFNYEVFMNTKNKLFILNKDVSKVNLDELRVNSLGLYFGVVYDKKEVRLSIEGSQIIGPIAKKNVLELKYTETKRWMSGEDFEVKSNLNGFVIIKNKEDYLGCGKISNKKLFNYVQKERRSSN